jgi:hypothetical protein
MSSGKIQDVPEENRQKKQNNKRIWSNMDDPFATAGQTCTAAQKVFRARHRTEAGRALFLGA